MDVELASKTIGRVRKAGRIKRGLDRLMIWGVAILSGVLVIIGGVNLWVSRTNQLLSAKAKAVEQQIKAASKLENQQLYLVSKLESFAGLVASHELHQSLAETVFSLVPSGTSLKGFEVQPSGEIVLSGSVPNWQLLSQLLSRLDGPTEPLTLKQYKIKQINFTEAGVGFTVELTIVI